MSEQEKTCLQDLFKEFVMWIPKRLEEFAFRVQYFKQHIDGEEGLKFITSLCGRAGYTEVSPTDIQINLLNRIHFLDELIASIKNESEK